MMGRMVLTVTTDPEQIASLVDARLAADPVRRTVLGTIRLGLTQQQSWSAVTPAGAMAVRSDPSHPVHVDGSWLPGELDALAAELERLPRPCGVGGPIEIVTEVVQRLSVEPCRRMAQRLFRIDELHPPHGVPGQARRAVDADWPTVHDWYVAFAAEAGAAVADLDRAVEHALAAGGCWLWQDTGGAPVSLATRRPVMAGSARIGPVYTPPQQRRHGYGSAVTAAATADVLGGGAVPVLFTDLANPISNDIYQRLGYRAVEDMLNVEFR
jgi:hypothetical protein